MYSTLSDVSSTAFCFRTFSTAKKLSFDPTSPVSGNSWQCESGFIYTAGPKTYTLLKQTASFLPLSAGRYPPNLQAAALAAKSNTVISMGLDVTIRSARLGDAEDLHAISLCPGVRSNTSKMPHMPITKIMQELENPSPGDVKLVAVIDNRVIGTLGIHVNSNPARKHAAYIGMAVHDECQGCGVGTRLLTEAIDLAERWMGLRRLELEVFSSNARALNLYKRHGFKVEGYLKEYAFRDGEFVDAVAMARVAGLNK